VELAYKNGLFIATPSGVCAQFGKLLVYLPKVEKQRSVEPTLRCVWKRDSGKPFPSRYRKTR
jgi:hypothetical protein